MSKLPTSFLEILMSGGNPQEKEPDKILPEARLARLRGEFARYGRNPFKPGDIVTALPSSIIQGCGLPMIVLEIRDPATPIFGNGENDGSPGFGGRPAVRCAHLSDCGHILRHWYEAEDLELYAFMPNVQETGRG